MNSKEQFWTAVLTAVGITLILAFIFGVLKDPLLIAIEVVVIGGVFAAGLLLGRSSRHDQDIEMRRMEIESWSAGRQELSQMYSNAMRLVTAMLDRSSSIPPTPQIPPPSTPRIGLIPVAPTTMVDNDKMVADAEMVYHTLYNKGTHPTQAVLTGMWPELFKNHEYMTKCLDYLAATHGVVTQGVKGKERTWFYQGDDSIIDVEPINS